MEDKLNKIKAYVEKNTDVVWGGLSFLGGYIIGLGFVKEKWLLTILGTGVTAFANFNWGFEWHRQSEVRKLKEINDELQKMLEMLQKGESA